MKRIAICGIHIESSTFTPYLSRESDFTVRRGTDLLARYPWLTRSPIPGREHVPDDLAAADGNAQLVRPWSEEVEWVPVLHCSALPGGPVERETYETWRDEICAGLREAGHLDGIFFDIHGAMSVPGYDDAEGDLINAIRQTVGPDPIVSASMDLHGNVSKALFEGCDMLTCYRMAPHEDAWVSRERAARNLAERLLAGKGKPAKALSYVPVLLPGEKTSTRLEPARSLYGMIPEIEQMEGVTDISIWIGFAWADQPRCKAAIAAFGDDEMAITDGVRTIATAFWEARNEFSFVAPTASFDDALATAVQSDQRPFVISDSGDNPGAGGADDVTVTLSALLNETTITQGSLTAVLASIYDPAAVAVADAAGVGATIDVSLGGKVDTRAPGPVPIQAAVEAVVDDPQGLRTAVLAVGGLRVIVTSRRNQYTTLSQFARVGIDPRQADILVVKIGYLEPDLHALAADWILALTPGGVDQDIVRLGHTQIDRPMFPFDPDMSDPDLTTVIG